MPGNAMRKIYSMAATVGLFGGFLMAYQDSSSKWNNIPFHGIRPHFFIERLWGWSENTREQEMAKVEIRKKIAEGKPIYGTSNQPEHMQQVAVSNSRHSQLFFSVIPWYVALHPFPPITDIAL